MNIRTTAQELFKGKETNKNLPKRNSRKKSKFNFPLYATITSLLVAAVGGINWLIDPLWYSHGNLLTGKNFAFNERISKANLFFRTKDTKNYDCLILGSSRVITLRASQFTENQCFNYALKGAEIEEFIQYARSLKAHNFAPKKVYIGVDGFNFVIKKRQPIKDFDIASLKTPSPLHAYLSADVFTFSLMTLLGISPDPGNYYDRNFEGADFEDYPVYQPDFYKPQEAQKCDFSIVDLFASLRKVFPQAEFVGYVAPRSAWSIVNDTYGRELTVECELPVFYELAQLYDVMYDFSIPSVVTKDTRNTFDGSHYSVKINDEIAKIMEGKANSFGIRVDRYSFEEYRQIYLDSIKQFLEENNQMQRWRN
jgi:hypothetical protein